MAIEIEQSEEKDGPKRHRDGRFYQKLFALGRKVGYRFGIMLSIGLAIFVGYHLITYLAKAQQKLGSQAGTFYGERLSGSGYLIPEIVEIPSGSFDMGSEDGENDERPVHNVSIDA